MGSLKWVLRNRWMMLVAGVWIMCCSGTSYLYSDYSTTIKETLHYDQETLDTVGFFKEVGESVGIVSGLLYDVLPLWAVLLVGAIQCSGGYLMTYLAVSGTLATPPVWAISLFLCVGANGQTFFITAVLVSLVKRFPMSRGMVIGTMKGLVGLSAAVLSSFAKALYSQRNDLDAGKNVLLLLAWFPASVVAGSYVFFRSKPGDSKVGSNSLSDLPEYEEQEPLFFSVFAGSMLSLAAFLLGNIALQNTQAYSESLSRGVALVTLVLLLLPLGIVYVSRLTAAQRNDRNCVASEPLLLAEPATPLPQFSDAAVTITRVDSFQRAFPARGENHTLPQALRNADFWLLVVIAMIGMGSGLTAMDNVGQLGTSLGYSQSTTNSFVSMVSIWNFLGRLGAGALSELALHQKGLPRPFFLMGALTTLAIGHTMLALAFPGALYIGSVLIGLSYGAHWSLIPTATSELFGLRHFGTLLNAVTMASPVGSYVLSVRVAGYFYDAEANKQHPRIHAHGARPLFREFTAENKEYPSCGGAVCFRAAFFIMATICCLGCGLCALLFARTRKYYTEVVYEACQMRTHHCLAVSRDRHDDMEQHPSSST